MNNLNFTVWQWPCGLCDDKDYPINIQYKSPGWLGRQFNLDSGDVYMGRFIRYD